MLHTIEAEVSYVRPQPEPLYLLTYDLPPGTKRTNMESDPHRVAIADVRGDAADLSLDVQGFALIGAPTRVGDLGTAQGIDGYYREAVALLRSFTGADKVHIFDHTIRRRIAGAGDRDAATRQPVARVHVDQTLASGPMRVRDLFPDEAEALLAGRVQIINLWRPIEVPALDAPLAVCDARSVDPDDLMPAAQIYPDRRGETYAVRFNPRHRWAYAPAMQPDEALLLKCYDSLADGRARFTPHCAFLDPTAPVDAPPRQSIEVRALVFHAA